VSDDSLGAGVRRDVADRLEAADGVFLGLDFDGTLAPIAEDPERPTITPAARTAVERFVARPDAQVAVVSGRALSDLRHRVGIDEAVYAGNHGLELDGPDAVVHPVGEDHRPAIEQVVDYFDDRVSDVQGLRVEDKGATATVHVRTVPSERVDEVRSHVERAVASADGDLRVTTGKQVFEIRPDVDWDKGTTMDHLSADVPTGWTTVYVGDDVTDEDAFRAVRPDGFAVLVGDREETAADYRLPGTDAVPPLLNWIADCIIGHPRTAEAGTQHMRRNPCDRRGADSGHGRGHAGDG